MKKRISLAILSLTLALIMMIGVAPIGFTASAAGEVTCTPKTQVLGNLKPITITVSSGLEPGWYYLRLFNAHGGEDGVGSSGITDWTVLVETGITVGEDGTVTMTTSAHVDKITKTGTYAFAIQQQWSTKARVFFEVVAADTPYIEKTTYSNTESISINWDIVPDNIGWAGIYPKDCTDMGNYGDYLERSEASVRSSFPTDQAGRHKSITWPAAEGDYKIVFFEGSGYTVAETYDIHIESYDVLVSHETVEVGFSDAISVTVEGGLKPNKTYGVRMYHSNNSSLTSADSGLGNTGVNWGGGNATVGDFTTDANGAGTISFTTHSTFATTAGVYAVTFHNKENSWDTEARAFFTVVESTTAYLEKDVYLVGDSIAPIWDNIPETIGWAGIYPKGYTDTTNYGDYIERSEAETRPAFPSGVQSRYKAFSWPASAGDYTVVFFVGSGYTVAKEVDISIIKYDVTATPDTYVLGSSVSMELYVEAGLSASKWYATRIYKAQDGFGPADSGFGNAGVLFGSQVGGTNGAGVTTNTEGGATWTETLHNTAITEPGTYVYTIHDTQNSWNTVARVFFTVTEPVFNGDVNGDGDIDVRDLVRIQKWLVEISDDDTGCDVNGDGYVDANDTKELRQYIIKN